MRCVRMMLEMVEETRCDGRRMVVVKTMGELRTSFQG